MAACPHAGTVSVPACGHAHGARSHIESPRMHDALYYQKSVMAENTTLHVGQKYSNKNHDKQIDPKVAVRVQVTGFLLVSVDVIKLHYPTQTPVLLSGSRLYRQLFLRLTN